MDINGVVNIYKEAGYTSHDVVAKLRGILRQKKIGHTGTLDPDAVGVLPVCLGRGTRLCDMLADHDKVYEAVLRLGISTDTQDMSGTILQERPVEVSAEDVEKCVASFVGEQMQIPPMYSAIKINGKKLYELAREGKEVERQARKVVFYEIEVLAIALPNVTIRVHCSKGTYIRTLCNDIGEKLGCGGCMEKLLRTRVARFELKDAKTLDEIRALVDAGTFLEIVTPVDEMFAELPKLCTVAELGDKMVHNGNSFPEELAKIEVSNGDSVCTGNERSEELSQNDNSGKKIKHGMQVRIYDSNDAFIGIFEKKGKYFAPVKMFFTGQN